MRHVCLPHAVRALLLTVVVTMLALVGQPAHADVVLRDYVELPVPSVSQLLAAPQTDDLAIASWSGEVTIFDRATGAVQTVPETVGTGRLTTGITGDLMYGVTRQGGSITELDLNTLTARSWSVGGCPIDAVGRQGAIFYVAPLGDDCYGSSDLMRLDPTTGEATRIYVPEIGTPHSPTIVPVPGQNRFLLVERGTTGARTWVVDVAADGSLSVVAKTDVGGQPLGGRAFLTDEADAVVIGTGLYALPGLEILDDDLGVTNRSHDQRMTQVSSAIISFVDSRESLIRVHRRTDAGVINTFRNPVKSQHDPTLIDARVDDGTLYVVANSWSDGTARLYTDPSPTIPAPEVTIDQSAGRYDVGEPVMLHGTLTHDGAPVAGAPVVLTLERLPSDRTLATVTTDDTGGWSYEFVPDTGGWHQVQASYVSDGRESIDTTVFLAEKLPSTLTLSGPTSVEPGSAPVTIEGGLSSEGAGLGGRPVSVEVFCMASWDPFAASTETTADDGTFSFTFTPPDGEICRWYWAKASIAEDPKYAADDAWHETTVDWRRAELTVDLPASAYVQDEVAAIATLTVDGAPVGDAVVGVRISSPDQPATTYEATTAADGTLRIPFTATAKGNYTVQVTRAATSDTLGASAEARLSADKVSTTLTVESAPTAVAIGDSVKVRARLQRDDGRHEGAEVGLIAVDENGSRRELVSTTDAEGYVDFLDEPGVAGSTDYVVRYVGDTRYAAAIIQRLTVNVVALSPTVTLRTDRTSYTAGQTATITVGVTGSETRHVVVTARRSDGQPVVLFDGSVPAEGLVLTRTMRHTETITARHPSDARHSPHQVGVSRDVRLDLTTAALRPIERIGKYSVYRRTADPTFETTSRPTRPGICLRMHLQEYADDAWRTMRTSACRTVNEYGKARWTLTGTRTVGVRFRTRATFAGDSLNTNSKGSWSYFRFR